MALDEGKMGRKDDPQLSREQAIEQARNAGFLGSTGTADISSGFDDKNVYGGLLGDDVGEMEGGFGFGRSGFGPGGGGTGTGTIGTGRYGTIGHGDGTASGYGVGGGRGGMRGRTAAVPSVAIGQPSVQGELDRAIIRRYIKRNIQKIQYCYEKELLAKPALTGMLTTKFLIAEDGKVPSVEATGVDPTVASCVAAVIKSIEFPRPRTAQVQVIYPFAFRPDGSASAASLPVSPEVAREIARDEARQRRAEAEAAREAAREEAREQARAAREEAQSEDDQETRGGPPLTGKLAEVMAALKNGNTSKALGIARAWHEEAPGDVLALIALGESLEATKDVKSAARIYGSIIDLYPTRADFRRFAGERLERLGAPNRDLVIDTYRRAVADRPDHVTGHRLLAYALLRAGDHAGAFAAILAGIDGKYPGGRFAGAARILQEDAGMIGAVYAANGGKRDDITAELKKRSLALIEKPSTRFIMYWETDSNDVDFHIRDSRGGHAWYSHMQLPSGGELYADVTTGYGPECFAIPGTPTAGPYKLSINYYSQGPMGYGMGLLQIQKFDGKKLTFDDRPYMIMRDHAFVDLGTFP
jgi:tetratricopeptide (TPR) repeat protein